MTDFRQSQSAAMIYNDMEDGSVEAEIYIVQKFENRILEVLRFMPEWRHLHFGRLCNPFFGGDEEELLKELCLYRRKK